METWLARTGHPRGAVLTFARMWRLVQPWYAGRMSDQWRGRTALEAQAILESTGLTDDFWRLA